MRHPVIVVGHAGITTVARNVDIFYLVIEGQAIKLQMQFQKATMRMGLNFGQDRFDCVNALKPHQACACHGPA